MISKWLRKAFPNKVNIGCFLVAMLVLIPMVVIGVRIMKSLRHYARIIPCHDHMRKLGVAFAQYTQDNDGFLPARQERDGANGKLVSWRVPINAYVKNPAIFQCSDNPAIGKNNDIERDGFSRSYAVNSANDGKRRFGPFADQFPHGLRMAKIGSPEGVIMVTETTAAYNDINVLLPQAFTKLSSDETKDGSLFAGHQQAINVLYCDGHSRFSRTQQLLKSEKDKNPWTINSAPFAPADQEKLKKVLDFAQKQDW
jgi:prepilin-type processing-associated H-X9-DG protein